MPQSEEFATPAIPNGQLYPLLVQANRAEVLASMSRELAHDLKGPMQALFLFDLEDRAPEMESVFRMAVDRMADTIERVTRIYMPRPSGRSGTPFTVPELITAVREMYEAQRSLPATELVTDIPDTLPPVTGHEWEWQHILINLLMNARESAGEGPGARIRLTAREAGGTVEITVRDTGAGVPSDRSEWIFQPLTSTKNGSGVHGLGLPVARWLAHRNDGSVRLDQTGHGGGFVASLRSIPNRPAPQG